MTSNVERQPPVRPLFPDERIRDELADVVEGQRLCVIGRGTAAMRVLERRDNFVHRHVTVTTITKQFINSEYRSRGTLYKNRHRRDSGRSTPLSEYGGTTVHLTCQRPEDKLRPLRLKPKVQPTPSSTEDQS